MPVLRALVLLPLVLALACSGGGEVTPVPQPGEPQASDESDPNTISANPAADLEGDCEPRPATTGDGRRELRADLRAVNTGNLGVKVRVAATWPQPHGIAISRSQRLRLEEGEAKDVRLRLLVADEDAAAISKHVANGRACHVYLRVTGAFGMPSEEQD